jgi:UDP-N-acetylmuramoylalanine--D-glutamate ligase
MKIQATSIDKKTGQSVVIARRANMKWLNDIEHRLEYVDTINGVEYVNDAKATDVNSSWYSLDCMEKPVIWIISSCQYEEDYNLFYEIDTKGIKALVILGDNPESIRKIYSDKINQIVTASSMNEALVKANGFACAGDVVLYSPAFSHMDQYRHYKENGQLFRKAVREVHLK